MGSVRYRALRAIDPFAPEKKDGAISRSRRSVRGTARTAEVRLVADQHSDSTVAPELRVAESAGLDLGRRHSGHDQCVANDHDAAFVGAVESDLEGRILIEVVRDLLRLVAVGAQDLVTVGVEGVRAVRAPAFVSGQRALGAGWTDQALRSSSAGSASWAGDATQLGAALGACISGCACAPAGRPDRSGLRHLPSLRRSRLARRAALTDRADRAISTGRTDMAWPRRLGGGLRRAASCDGKRRNDRKQQRAFREQHRISDRDSFN